MNAVFSQEGLRGLRVSWILLVLAAAACAALGFGSYWYLQNAKREGVDSATRLQTARARTEAIRRELEDLRTSSKVFEDLLGRGVLQEERRLDFIERLDQLKASHRLAALEYDIDPQRVLPLAGGKAFSSLDVMGSQVKLRFKTLHEGDALAFLEDLSTPPRGFNAMSRCHLQRIERVGADVSSPRVEANCALEWISLKDKGKARAN
jgi:hypothetical protein